METIKVEFLSYLISIAALNCCFSELLYFLLIWEEREVSQEKG